MWMRAPLILVTQSSRFVQGREILRAYGRKHPFERRPAMSQFMRKFGIDIIMLMVLVSLLAGIAKIAFAAP